MPRLRQSSPISSSGCTVPISLLASITETRMVCSVSAASSTSEVHAAVALHVEVGDLGAGVNRLGPALEQRVLVQLVLQGEGVDVLRLHLGAGQLHQPEQLELVQPVLAHALQALAGVEDGLVLGLEGDDVVALGPVELRHALERQVVRLGGAAGEDDLVRLRADERCHLLPGLLHRRLGPPSEGMVPRRRVAKVLAQVGQHRLQHPRVERGRGMVIHVDGQAHGLPKRLPTLAYQCGPVESIIRAKPSNSRLNGPFRADKDMAWMQ